jgi:hypothetical protein
MWEKLFHHRFLNLLHFVASILPLSGITEEDEGASVGAGSPFIRLKFI